MRIKTWHRMGLAAFLAGIILTGMATPTPPAWAIAPEAHAGQPVPPPVADMPWGIVAGRDGALWFTETGGDRIGRITASGAMREFAVPTPRSGPASIAVGPDGAIWFTEAYADQIGRLDPATGRIAEYPVPDLYGQPSVLAVGDDGNLYFTQNGDGSIGRLNPRTGRFSQVRLLYLIDSLVRGPDGAIWFTVGRAGATVIGRLGGTGGVTFYRDSRDFGAVDATAIAVGPDGALWFALAGSAALGRLSTTGAFVKVAIPGGPAIALAAGPGGALWWSSYPDAVGRLATTGKDKGRSVLFPLGDHVFAVPAAGLAVGPGGDVWCTLAATDVIARLTPSGQEEQFAIASAPARPFDLAVAPDSSAWITLPERNRVAHVTIAGRVKAFIPPTPDSEPAGISVAPDGSAWFTEYRASRLAHVDADGSVLREYVLPPGTVHPFSVAVAPGGLVWWTEYPFNVLANLDSATGSVVDYPGTVGIDPGSLVVRADGHIWLADRVIGAIDRFYPAGHSWADFRIPEPIAHPYALLADPCAGAVFLLDGKRLIGRIDAAGRVTLQPVPGNGPLLSLAVTGTAAYFTDTAHDAIGRISTGGTVSYLPVPTAGSNPMGLTAAPDGSVWFIEFNPGQLARIDPVSGAIREYPLTAAR